MAGIWIGTSGWTYDDWRGPFYPPEVRRKDWLSWYATQLSTTEVNGSFYRTPSLDAVRRWRDETPDGFLFAWKASRFITHWKRLKDEDGSSVALMKTRLDVLGDKLGPVLFQLPARFKAKPERLESFLARLPRHFHYAFEFRDPSWYEAGIIEVLKSHGVALCISDHHQAPSPWLATARHVYVRGHGPGGRYRDNYPDATLSAWADRILEWQRGRRDVFVYFDNDQKSAAPADARRLIALVEERRQQR